MTEPNETSNESAPETRQRLLDAACEVFAEVGYGKATIRAICRRAGANVAAVNYHFRGKDGLYLDVLRYARSCAMSHEKPGPAEQGPPEVRLRHFVQGFLCRMFDTGKLAWHEKMMAQAMAEPTPMLEKLIDAEIRPRARRLEAILREMLGPHAEQDLVERCARSVVGQCLFYRLCRPVIERLHPHQKYEPDDVAKLAEHITTFSLNAIKGFAQELLTTKARRHEE